MSNKRLIKGFGNIPCSRDQFRKVSSTGYASVQLYGLIFYLAININSVITTATQCMENSSYRSGKKTEEHVEY